VDCEVKENRTLAMHEKDMGAPFGRIRPPKGISTHTL
jgi:hypothetical protein